jgi:hypothetical protein
MEPSMTIDYYSHEPVPENAQPPGLVKDTISTLPLGIPKLKGDARRIPVYAPPNKAKHYPDDMASEFPQPAQDPTNPGHYTRYKIQPMEFIQENNLPFWLGNVIKYALRYDAKDGVQDLKKARRYLDMQIEHTEGNPDWITGSPRDAT